ncbi:MAG: sialidase family protein [Terriglobia bacterium]
MDGGIVQLKNGFLLLVQGGTINENGGAGLVYRISKNGGEAWSQPRPLHCGIETSPLESTGMIRLRSGALALYAGKRNEWYFALSRDEGNTWTKSQIATYPDFYVLYHSLIQLTTGRLLLTGVWMGLMPDYPDLVRVTDTGWGWWRGRKLYMEGERAPYLIMGLAYHSADEGKTWKQDKSAGLFGWFDEQGVPNGFGGATEVDETVSAETKDGRILLFGRSKVGRLVQSYSSDGGDTWCSVQPTDLASSQSPPLLIRLPQTGDLLCVWNQASGEEIRRGMLRNRLSSAISEDSGVSWKHFKNIELSEGVADVAYVTPEFPIPRQILGRPGLGQLPDAFAMFTYPNVDIVGDHVFIRYSRMWPEPKKGEAATNKLPTTASAADTHAEAEMKGEPVLRIYPLEWFYRKSES